MTTLTAKRSMIILIDNGHGKETAGKCSPDGTLKEYAFTRKIAEAVAKRLIAWGYNAVMLVTEENDVPLTQRCRRANKVCAVHGKENVILVSIHCNAAGNGKQWMKGHGWEAYSYYGNSESDRLASCLYAAAELHLPGHSIRKDMSDGDCDKEAGFYILRYTQCAAVLTENLFMDNKEDAGFLLSEEGFERIVRLHVGGIMKFLLERK